MEKQKNISNKKVVTFKIAGEVEPTPNPVYDCVVPIYSVDFPCRHKKQPWWESELNYPELQDLLNIWFYELQQDIMLFQNQVKEQNERDLIISTNQEKVISLAKSLNQACIQQRNFDCELEKLTYQMDCLDLSIQSFEKVYSSPMCENQCKLMIFRIFEDINLKLRQTEYILQEVQLECDDRVTAFRERGVVGRIFSIISIYLSTMQKAENKIEAMAKLLDLITVKQDKYVNIATEYAHKNNDFDLISDIEKFKKNAP